MRGEQIRKQETAATRHRKVLSLAKDEKITGSEESLRFLRDQFPRNAVSYEIRSVLSDAIDDAATFGTAELDLSELSEAEIAQIVKEAEEMEGHQITVERSGAR